MATVDPPALRADHSSVSLRVHLTLFIVQVAFGSLAVEGKVAMGPSHHVSPRALAMVRILGGAAVFIGAHLALRTPKVARLRDMLHLALLSLFGVVLNQALFLAGLRQTSPVAATLLVAMIPVFTAGVAALTGRERLSLRAAAGIGVALFGVIALSGFALPHRGDVLVLLNSLSYAFYVVFARSALERFGPVTVVAWVFGCGALLFAPLGAVALAHEAPTWSLSTSSLIAFIVLVPTVFAYSANAWALRRATPTLVTIYVYLQPLIVAALSFLQLGHALDLRTALSGIVIFAGVGLVASAPRRGPADPSDAARATPR
jgi:drug/metabolite transporter (DMT)-like permease